jgi:hypothetical protein
MEKTLNKDDVAGVLLRVQEKAKILGLLLKVPRDEIEQYNEPQERLFHVIDEFLKISDPRPTWRAIVVAVRDPLIGENSLADDIEKKYCSVHDEDSKPLTSTPTTSQSPMQTDKPTRAMDETLDEEDAIDTAHKLLGVQGKTEMLGRLLKLPKSIVDVIHSQFSDPRDCLFHVIEEFLSYIEEPTWRVIISTLRDPLIGESSLADDIEKKHFPIDDESGSQPVIDVATTLAQSHEQTAMLTKTMEEALDPDDAIDIVRELLVVRGKTEIFGRMLKLPKYFVDSIHHQYSDPAQRLLHVIDKFVKQLGSWRVIVAALRSPLIQQSSLADMIERKYFQSQVSTPGQSAYTQPPHTPSFLSCSYE